MPARRDETFTPTIHPQERTGNFRLNAKHLFLTYPRFTTEKQVLFDYIDSKYKIKRAIIAEESHEDGAKHLHAYVEFQRKLDLRNWDVFDFNGHHCNLGAARKPEACINYCKKEDTSPLLFGLDSRDSIESLCELASSTPDEKDYLDICFKNKVTSIHYLGQSDLRQMGQEAVSGRDTRFAHNSRGLSPLWDDYLTSTALLAMEHGYEISMDQRTNERGEDYLGTDTFTQTLTIRTPYGHSLKIQTVVSQESDLRRYELHTPTSRSTTSSRRSSQSSTSTRPLWGSSHSPLSTPCLSI